MPFCSQCGNQVDAADRYCARCGSAQPVEPGQPPRPAGARPEPLASLSPRTASILCYIPVVGWVPSIIVLAADKFRTNRAVRFHAFQGLYLFVAWLIVQQVIAPWFRHFPGEMFRMDRVLSMVILGTWIFMLIKASHDEVYSLPIIGELAERSLSERA
jgi:uncharacterized membrane protein